MTETRGSEPMPELARGQYFVEVECETTDEGERKVGHADYLKSVGHPNGSFTVYSDEPAVLGGQGSAPLPVEYLLLGVGF